MYRKLAINDIKKSKLITATITAFIFLAALLTSLAAALIINLFGAIDGMTEASQTPDLVYMHSGEIDLPSLDAFAQSDANADAYQVLNFLNIEGNRITLDGISLADSVQDNGFAAQSEKFDFMLDMNGDRVTPRDGEIYVPVYYMLEYGLEPGSTAIVNGKEFTIAGFVRDPLFNPSMASAKRFLVSEGDYESLEPGGRLEYLIEFIFKDKAQVPGFMSRYLEAGMPSNGPPGITQRLLTMMNALSDGIMIAVLILISLLVVIVTFLCIRFTLISKTEGDFREIGVLKAIGISVAEIKRLYLTKYGLMSAAACVSGFAAGLFAWDIFMESIRAYFGTGGGVLPGVLAGAAGAALIFLIIVLYVNHTLNRFRKISATQAIRFGFAAEKRKTLYITMFAVLIISAFILTVPRNLYDTVSSSRFMTTMGIGLCDMLIVVQQTDDIRQKTAEISERLSGDADVANHAVYTTYTFGTAVEDGLSERIQVTIGDHSAYPIEYSEGRMPGNESEIALSALLADDMGKSVGDQIVLKNGGGEERLTVCGIYSDVTNAGSTAKAMFEPEITDVWQSSICVSLGNGDVGDTVRRYKNGYPFAKVADIADYTAQSIGSLRSAVQSVSYAAIVAAAALTFLICLLFNKMLVTKDRFEIATLKAIGFTSSDIRRRYITRAFAVFLPSVVVGTILANTLGEYIGALMISSFGATSFNFDINPAYAYVFSPLLIAACVFAATRLGLSDIAGLKISDHIKEAN